MNAKPKALTDAQDDEQDHEGVQHREQRRGDGGDHLGQLVHSPEEPNHPECPHQPHQPERIVEWSEVQQRHEDDEEIKPVPPVSDELEHPVGEHVDAELDGENTSEEEIDVQNKIVESLGALLLVLSIQHTDDKVLSNGTSVVFPG